MIRIDFVYTPLQPSPGALKRLPGNMQLPGFAGSLSGERLWKEEIRPKLDRYWRKKDARWIRFVTRHGFKFVMDDRGSDKKDAEGKENPRGYGVLIKGRRSPGSQGQPAEGNPTGFFWPIRGPSALKTWRSDYSRHTIGGLGTLCGTNKQSSCLCCPIAAITRSPSDCGMTKGNPFSAMPSNCWVTM